MVYVILTVHTFPLIKIWYWLLPQFELTLNIIRALRVDPHLSYHMHIYITLDYNHTTIPPPSPTHESR